MHTYMYMCSKDNLCIDISAGGLSGDAFRLEIIEFGQREVYKVVQ